jgi:2-desacetyl-2-hydroxyethyl bacteriochlorophyllide A dehydrogenase
MNRLAVHFSKPFDVKVVEESLSDPAPDQVRVRTIVSAISPGTELLVYRGEWPKDLAVDESIPSLAGGFSYPLKYGYAAVGRVAAVGELVNPQWMGRLVFSFNPHESSFLCRPDSLIPVPDSLSPEEAAFLPNMETAVSFLMDGRPMIGEYVAVMGQGIVGLLTTALLARLPLGRLVTLDRFSLRREKSLALGADAALDPADGSTDGSLKELFHGEDGRAAADLIYELSGNPAALDSAVSLAGFGGRIVVGSWYGEKRANLDLGGRFHRDRIRIVSSQVSTLAPEFTGLWTKQRRLGTALRMLEAVKPARLITHRFPVAEAAQAYAVLHNEPHTAVQIMITYEDAL